jgi:hypothetical protein
VWRIDCVIPMRDVESEGTGKDRADCMRRFRAAWDRFSSDPARLTEFLEMKAEAAAMSWSARFQLHGVAGAGRARLAAGDPADRRRRHGRPGARRLLAAVGLDRRPRYPHLARGGSVDDGPVPSGPAGGRSA